MYFDSNLIALTLIVYNEGLSGCWRRNRLVRRNHYLESLQAATDVNPFLVRVLDSGTFLLHRTRDPIVGVL
jgi:hypothetical protein